MQTPDWHLPLQHCEASVQLAPLDLHDAHQPLTESQAPEQHCPSLAQREVLALHDAHQPLRVSQLPLQHSASSEQNDSVLLGRQLTH